MIRIITRKKTLPSPQTGVSMIAMHSNSKT